jgi:CRISPR system Cascade subunit CasD
MSALLLRLAGPLQSWGYRSRFSDRDTGLEPTKSGVVGMLCCALGRDRGESPEDLATLKMHVCADREGTLLTDYHTAGGGLFRGSRKYFAPTSSGSPGKNTVVTQRHYLQDAVFLVALEGEKTLLEHLAERLEDPVWPLALGRRSCPPSVPVLAGLRDADGETALREEPLRLFRRHIPRQWDTEAERYVTPAQVSLRLVLECGPEEAGAEMRRDVPVAWPHQLDRQYTMRFVRTTSVKKKPEVADEPVLV